MLRIKSRHGKGKDSEYYWIDVENDELEYIKRITDTAIELANLCGVSESCVRSSAKHYENGRGFSRFRRVKR